MKRALPLLVALVIAVLAFLSAFGVNTALRLAVALPDDATLEEPGAGEVSVASAETPGEPPPARSRGLSRKQYIDAILERNIFDHTKIGQKSEGGGGEALTDLNVRLLATIVAEPEQFSSALIAEEGRDGKAAGYGIGDKLFDAEIVGIEQKKVTLKRSDGTIEVLTMEAKGDSPPDRSAAATAPAGDDAEGISELGDNRYAVDRALVDKYLTDIEAVSKMARAIPHRGPDGEIDGYRLSGIRRNSPLSQLGIRNGDVIHSVNGQSLASMQEAMAAYQQLQGGSSFSFEVTRRGQRQTMEYEIR